MLLLSWKPFFGIRGISLLRSHLSQRNGLQIFFAPNAIVLALGATSHLLSAVPSIDASKPVNTIPMRP
jgi:hypothetical protein